MEYYAGIEMNELLLHATKWINLTQVKEIEHQSIHPARFHLYKV